MIKNAKVILKAKKKEIKSRVHLLNSFNLLNRNVNEFRKALTHASYYGTEEESLGCSRYVFLGMFGFKGKVAKLLYDYVPGKGQSLQHILGNLFAISRMEAFFDKWELEKFCRCGPNFKISLHKHIFAYSILGYVLVHANEYELKDFITKNILDDQIIQAAKKRKSNLELQLKALVLQKYEKKPNIIISQVEGKQRVEVIAKDRILSVHESKSKKYAKSKAIKKAILLLLDEEQEQLKTNKAFVAMQQQKEALLIEKQKKEKEAKHQLFLIKQAQKKQERDKRLQEKQTEKELEDKKRKSAKAKRKQLLADKEKKEKQKLNTVMNAGKRRFLEDKLK